MGDCRHSTYNHWFALLFLSELYLAVLRLFLYFPSFFEAQPAQWYL